MGQLKSGTAFEIIAREMLNDTSIIIYGLTHQTLKVGDILYPCGSKGATVNYTITNIVIWDKEISEVSSGYYAYLHVLVMEAQGVNLETVSNLCL